MLLEVKIMVLFRENGGGDDWKDTYGWLARCW